MFLLWKLFNFVAKHVTRHGCAMVFKPVFQALFVTFASLTEKPPNGFLKKVVKRLRLFEEDFGDGIGVIQLTMAEELHGADHTDALLPNGLAVAGKVVKQCPVLVQKPYAKQFVARKVNQVPIVNILGVPRGQNSPVARV